VTAIDAAAKAIRDAPAATGDTLDMDAVESALDDIESTSWDLEQESKYLTDRVLT
jgi:hypothetical protein